MKAKQISLLQIFIWLAAIESAATAFYLLSIPTDSKNAWLLGFSRSRLFVIGGMLTVAVAMIWLGIIFWRETPLSKKISAQTAELSRKRGFLWELLVFLVVLGVSGCLFLFQWRFASTDQQIKTYLERLTPVVLFGVVVCAQALVMQKMRFFKSERERWLCVLILLGGYILFLWLLVAEFFLADWLFPGYFVAERYAGRLQTWMPFILFQSALYVQLPYLLRHPLRLKFNSGRMGLLVIIGLAYFYSQAALLHAQETNTDLSRSDQDVYVAFTRRVSESDFTYSGVRNQTPGYPYFQALFCHANLTDSDLFLCGKQVNIILSLVLLALLFAVFWRFLPPYPAFVLLLIVAVSLFIFKAGYMTVELAYYFASFLSFLLMCLMLKRSSIKSGVGTGLILGVTYLLKASVLPGIALFILVFISKEIWSVFRRKTEFSSLKIPLASLALALVAFIAVIFPYIRQSKAIYGQYFYNANSTFYIWYDSWEDAKQAERDHAFTEGWPDLPAEQLPGLRKYIRDHSISQISERILSGLKIQSAYILKQYSAFNYLLIYIFITGVFFMINRASAQRLAKKHLALIFFVVFYILGYILLFAWYYPIAAGPRFFAGLYIPTLFSAFVMLKALLEGTAIRLKAFRIDPATFLRVANVVVVALLIADAFVVITEILPHGYFGS